MLLIREHMQAMRAYPSQKSEVHLQPAATYHEIAKHCKSGVLSYHDNVLSLVRFGHLVMAAFRIF